MDNLLPWLPVIIAILVNIPAYITGFKQFKLDKVNAEKTKAEAAETLTGTALKLVDELKEDMKLYKENQKRADAEIQFLKNKCIQYDNFIRLLIRQLKVAGIAPAIGEEELDRLLSVNFMKEG